MKKKYHKSVCKQEVPGRIADDHSHYDEALFEEYPDLEYSAISEGADAKDIFQHVSRQIPPQHLDLREELTEGQVLSKLGAASAKAKVNGPC